MQKKDFVIPAKCKLRYQEFELVMEAASYRVFKATHRDSNTTHMIKILDYTKEFVQKNYELATFLFNQEATHLQTRYPGFMLSEALETGDESPIIAFATLPYLPLSLQLDKVKKL